MPTPQEWISTIKNILDKDPLDKKEEKVQKNIENIQPGQIPGESGLEDKELNPKKTFADMYGNWRGESGADRATKEKDI